MTYKPPYTITSKMLDDVSKIMKLIGQLSSSASLDYKPNLRKTNKINSIYSSLAIENNALSKEQVRDIIDGKLIIGPQKDITEVKNAIKVYDDILEINPLDMNDLLKCHRIMMLTLIDDAGKFRKGEEGVFDGDQVIFMAPPAKIVPELMNNLFDYINHDEENLLIKSCVFHYEFEFIHPFSDGNGRMGRLFQTCLLAKEDELFAYLPIESIIKEKQSEYYKVIALSHQEGQSNSFIEFMLKAILETIERTSKDANKQYLYLSAQVKKLIEFMIAGIPYSALELMDLVGIKSRASFKINYLDPCLDAGIIKMTISDKPNSRNQRYIKV
ncbi:MAG: cell filamentation protein Fic [Tenericutes bacterium GWD2_38_27]|nr:MAG: cell filamentation protein Fic [Tenericutes bacterium GWD2_38_27]HBG33218.1 cell filamentation protein Fic [Acholeplasmataceae bacterium]HCB67196.1 cell filamentation protein Fic [Acholeplasmataceae bacterium]